MNKKLGVIVARFQINMLTKGHKALLNHVRGNSDGVLIVLGSPDISFTDKNPLPYEVRVKMLKDSGYHGPITQVKDNRDDSQWSKDLDIAIEKYINEKQPKVGKMDVTLYGSRDSFIPTYTGIYKTEIFQSLTNVSKVSATKQRKKIAILNQHQNNSAFRRGIIYTVENRFPTAYPTVDVAVIKISFESEVLLGRKPGRDKWCFPGGFVDPTDISLEYAAKRELSEEITGISVSDMEYISSCKIDDFRYKGTKDGIITSFFVTHFKGGTPVASDDLEEVRWFKISEIDEKVLSSFHQPLLNLLINHLYK